MEQYEEIIEWLNNKNNGAVPDGAVPPGGATPDGVVKEQCNILLCVGLNHYGKVALYSNILYGHIIKTKGGKGYKMTQNCFCKLIETHFFNASFCRITIFSCCGYKIDLFGSGSHIVNISFFDYNELVLIIPLFMRISNITTIGLFNSTDTIRKELFFGLINDIAKNTYSNMVVYEYDGIYMKTNVGNILVEDGECNGYVFSRVIPIQTMKVMMYVKRIIYVERVFDIVMRYVSYNRYRYRNYVFDLLC